MRAAVVQEAAPVVTTMPIPLPQAGEVLVKVTAAGLNRADLLQVDGHYPVPTGSSPVLGMEVSGIRQDTGESCVALVVGGGYAEYVSVPEGQLMPVPAGVPLVEAAGLPEVACTVHSNLGLTAHLEAGETVLIHGGTGGVGSFAVQYAKALGARVVTTVGDEEKRAHALALGADEAINHRAQDFSTLALQGLCRADVILDVVGARYLAANVHALKDGGRLVVIGLQGGTRAEIDLNALMRKRGSVIGTTLRSRTPEQKAAICRGVVEQVWPLVESGAITTQVHATFPLEQVAEAHALMRSGAHRGKILLTL